MSDNHNKNAQQIIYEIIFQSKVSKIIVDINFRKRFLNATYLPVVNTNLHTDI